MGYGMRKHPRFEDAVTFDDDEPDYRGFPNMTNRVRAHRTRRTREIAEATERLRRAGKALGAFVAEPQAHAERLEPALPGHHAHG